jgi:hypothetical protein
MTYQDQIRAILRLSVITLVLSALLAMSLIYPTRTERIVHHLPLSRSGDDYTVWLGILLTLAPICWAVLLGLITTSPEQEVRFVRWTKRWRRAPLLFEAIEFDTSDNDYVKSAWRYFLGRRRR